MPPAPIDIMLCSGLLLLLTAAIGAAIAWIGRPGAPRGPDSRRPNWALIAGLALLVIAFLPPLATLAAHSLLTAHLIQVTLVMGFAPPLLLLGLPATTQRHLPVWTARSGRMLTQPVVAIVIVNAVFFAWHATGPFNASLRHPTLYACQVASLLLASLAFWWPIVGPRASATTGMSRFHKLGYILFATIPQTFAGMTVALAGHPLYHAYDGVPRELGLSVISDQQIAGACMALVSKLALFAAFSVVFVRMLGDEAEGSEDDDDGGGRDRSPDGPAPTTPLTLQPGWFSLVESDPARDRVPAATGKT